MAYTTAVRIGMVMLGRCNLVPVSVTTAHESPETIIGHQYKTPLGPQNHLSGSQSLAAVQHWKLSHLLYLLRGSTF